MERIPEVRESTRQFPIGAKVAHTFSTSKKEVGIRGFRDFDLAVPIQTWKGKTSYQEEEELMVDAGTIKRSDDSLEDSGSTSFHGASHPPEPVDTDLMRPVYVPIGQKKGDGKCLVKNISLKGPFLDDLSIRMPNVKPSPSLLSPAESLVEEPNDLGVISSPFTVPRPSQNTETSLLPDSEEKECIWDASQPPSGNVSPLSSIDSTGVVRSMSIVNSCTSTYRSDGLMSDGMLSVDRNYESTKGSIRGDSLESGKTSLSRASDSSGLSDDSNWSNITGSANKPHKGNDPRWKAILAIRARDGILGMSHFKLLKRLGCGDIGSVYLSELSGTRCYFAMKVMDKASLASRKKLTRAQTEREILQLLDHPFLPTLYTHFETDRFSCLVMEYCPGGDLHTLRQRQPGKHFSEYAARLFEFTLVLPHQNNKMEEHLEEGDVQLTQRREISEYDIWRKLQLKEAESSLLDFQVQHNKERNYVNIILQVVIDIWPSLKLGWINEVACTLRSLKAELGTRSNHHHRGELVFALQYIDALEQLGHLWHHLVFSKEFYFHEWGKLECSLKKLGRCLRDMRYKLIGLTKEDNFLILELIIANGILTLCNMEACANKTTLKKLHSVMSCIEHICGEGSTEASNFVVEVQKSLSEIDTTSCPILDNPYLLLKSLEHFTPRKVVSSGNLKYMEAELHFQGNEFQNPLPFISGLPVGLSLDIKLHNISSESRLWIKMSCEEKLTQFVFLDLHEIEGDDEVRKFTFVAPFYQTPKANCFSLKICIVLECISDGDQFVRSCGGPKHEVVHLCEDKEVYFSGQVR